MSTQPPSNQSWQPTPNPPPMAYPTPPPRNSGIPTWAWAVGCGGIGCLTVPVILAAVLFPVFSRARDKARQTTCLSNEKLMATGLLLYSQDNDGALPEATHWMDKTTPYMPPATSKLSVFRCPSARRTPYGYAFNIADSQQNLDKMTHPAMVVTVYDSTAGTKNATDAVSSVPSPGRHLGGNNFAFVDGHVRFSKSGNTKTEDASN